MLTDPKLVNGWMHKLCDFTISYQQYLASHQSHTHTVDHCENRIFLGVHQSGDPDVEIHEYLTPVGFIIADEVRRPHCR